MSRRAQQQAVAAAALVLLVAGGLAALVLLRGPAAPSARLAAPPIDLRAAITPALPQFGDTITARVEVFVDTTALDPVPVRVDVRLPPYTAIGETRTWRHAGHVAVLRVETRLQCLQVACAPRGNATTFRFKPLTVHYRQDVTPRVAQIAWPALTVHSRLTPALRSHPALRVGAVRASAPSFRVAPHRAGVALLVLAGVLAAAGAALLLALAAAPLRARRRGPGTLERILHELQESAANGDSGRRRSALEELARELAPLDGELSRESSILAWAPSDPPQQAIADLARRTRERVG